MPSLIELVDRVNKGEAVDAASLEMYQDSANTAEKFLSHHAQAMLDLRRAHQHILQSLEAIDYSDQKVLNQFISISGFLGLTDQRANPVVRFGTSAIARRDYCLGLEAIQSAVAFDLAHDGTHTADRENCQFIETQYQRVAEAVGWKPADGNHEPNDRTHLAIIVSGLADDEPAARFLRNLARAHDSKRFKLFVYATEAKVRRDKQQFATGPVTSISARRGKDTLDFLAIQGIPVWIASTEGDLLSASRELAAQMASDRVDVAIFDADQSDPISAIVSHWDCAKAKTNLVRNAPLYSSGIGSVAYLDQIRFDRDKAYWSASGVDSRFILEGIELDAPLTAAPSRATYGIPSTAVVMATAGSDLDGTLSDAFVEAIITLLRAHPNAIQLFVGEGDLSRQKRKFESAGVSKRVGYAGNRRDLPGFLRIADLYLAEFPSSSPSGVLQAMAMSRAVMAMRWGDDVDHSQAAAFVGSEAATATRDPGLFIERAGKLIRDAQARTQLGQSLRQRVEQHFGFDQTCRHIEQLCINLLESENNDAGAEKTVLHGSADITKVA